MKYLLEQTKFFDSNSYEYNTDSKTGILLIHGFTNTTYEYRKLISFLSSKGFFVRADNLPGHGTTVEDCNTMKYTDWIEFTEKRLADLSARCNKIFICGISMGALLAMHLATVFPINGLITAAPVLSFNKPFKIRFLNPILCNILKVRPKKYEFSPSQKIYYGYNKWPLIALNEVRKLSNYINKKVLNKINCRTLLIHSTLDQVSLIDNYDIEKKYMNPKIINSLIVNESHHNIFDCDIEKDIIHTKILDFINSNT
jgi:carboxylesterase